MRRSIQLAVVVSWCGWLCASAGSAPPPAHSNVPAPTPAAQRLLRAEGTSEQGDLRVQIDPAAFQELQDSTGSIILRMPVDPANALDLKLERFEITTPRTRFVRTANGQTTAMPAPRVMLLRGEIADEPGSHAFLALNPLGGGTGLITRASGKQIHIGTDRRDGRAVGLVVRDGPVPAPDAPEFCATITPPGQPPSAREAPAAQQGPVVYRGQRVITVAIDVDQSFVQLMGGEAEAQAHIVQLIGAVSDIYMRDLNFRVVIGFSRLWPAGGEPFSADDLFGFANYWIKNEDLTGLNLVHMLSGRRDLPYGGVAFLADACSGFAFAISGFLNGVLAPSANEPHFNNWDVVVVAHEMGHNLGTLHTHDYVPPIDQCTSGENRRGTIMSYCHTRAGGLLNTDVRFHDRVQDEIALHNTPGACLWHDCNGNGIDDLIDVAVGESLDLNGDEVPDECQDCNGNGVLDPQEIAGGAADLNQNGIPDVCEPDCNGNGIVDTAEIALGSEQDRNGNRIPDACEPDCDGNGVADFADILDGTHVDLDRNAVPDICQDCDRNGQPDWLDVGRQFNWFVGQLSGPVREYHAISGVPIESNAESLQGGIYDVTFGPDRQLYATFYGTNSIVRLAVDGGFSSTFVASGAGGLLHPSALTFGPNGNLFVASQGTSSIIEYDGATGQFVRTFVAPESGSLLMPWDLTFGPNGNLFATSANNQVLEYDGSTGAFVGAFVDAENGNLDGPRGLAFLPTGELLVVNHDAPNITKYSSNGAYLGVFNDEYPMNQPWGITIGPDGNVYVARHLEDEIRIVAYDPIFGRYQRAFIRGDSMLTNPTGFAFRPASPHDINGNHLPDACDGLSCPADINGSGDVGVEDLLAVIESWGPCPSSRPCPTDIAPPGGDAAVGVNDLLAAINAWGPCS